MKLIMLETTSVAMDGIKIELCKKGEIYDFSDIVGKNLISGKLAAMKKVEPKVEPKKVELKKMSASPENKKVKDIREDKKYKKKDK